MGSEKFNRKEFLKRFGIGLGAITAVTVSPAFANFNADSSIDNDKKEFLKEYAGWLKEFQIFVKKRNQDSENIENNKRLMELSAEADKRKTKLETYMADTTFANYFNAITEDITNSI